MNLSIKSDPKHIQLRKCEEFLKIIKPQTKKSAFYFINLKMTGLVSQFTKFFQVGTDMEKVPILPRTHFVSNWDFRKHIDQNFHKQLELLWELLFIGYKNAKYLKSKKKFSHFIRFDSTVRVNNRAKSRNFHNSQ